MDYIPLNSISHFADASALVEGLGYVLVDLKIVPQKSAIHISVVIASKDDATIGVDDCSKVHRALLPRLQALLGSDNTYMELSSPGTERNIKNAAEFSLFKNRLVRVWDRDVSDWVQGVIKEADENSVTLDDNGVEKIYRFENIAKAKFLTMN